MLFTLGVFISDAADRFRKAQLDFDTGEAFLLSWHEEHKTQTKINEAITAVQAIIVDPKTDHRLEKVGR